MYSVPCGYRDIPPVSNATLNRYRRSLWVQGYTAVTGEPNLQQLAFPVGTGIYRNSCFNGELLICVPCGYRDIPDGAPKRKYIDLRSLWVQGYTAIDLYTRSMMLAFPVGTGIYRDF